MTQAPPPYAPPGQPYEQPAPPPPKKPIFKKWWFWAGIIVLIIIIAGVAGGGDDDASTSSPSAPASTSANAGAPAATEGAETSAPAPAPAPETTEAAPADDPLSDGDWTASDVQVENSTFGTSLTARITNSGDSPLTGIFTITVFDAGGARIGNFSGSANGVDAGDTQTVTFIGTTDTLEGDPATYTYEFQDDGSF